MSTVTVTVCRGCCCGTARKHPGVDHDGQVGRLRAAAGHHHRVRVSDCLNVCGESNVVVVQPTPEARRRGARPVWLGSVLDGGVESRIAAWVAAGGPGVVPIPPALQAHAFPAPRWKAHAEATALLQERGDSAT